MIVWAFETLLASTLLMLLVLAIRNPVRRSFGPGIAYALWALPVLRMLLPPLPASWQESAVTPITQAAEVVTYYVVEPMGGATPADIAAATPVGPVLWPVILIAIWTVGALGFIAYHLIAHERFTRRVRRLARSIRLVAGGSVEVIETDAATGPLAFGVLRKFVAFPRDFAERYDPLERDLALAHELGHHARGDLIANWVALVVLALHWFNPVAWRAFRAFRADQEMACDALVLAGRAAGLRHAYGRAIVKSAHGGAVSAACHLHTINELKGRLKMLNVHEKKSRSRLMAGSGATAALMLTGLGVTASGTQAAERVRTNIETAVGIDLAGIQDAASQDPLPPPPAPPVAGEKLPTTTTSTTTTTTTTDDDDKPLKRVRIIMKDKDGTVRTVTTDGDDAGLPTLQMRRVPLQMPRVQRITRIGKDGKPVTEDFAGMPELARLEALRSIPEINSRNCGKGEGANRELVMDSKDGQKRRIIICTNRTEARAHAAAEAAAAADIASVDVVRIERDALRSARDGLRAARRSIERSDGMTDAQRAAALKGIDEAMAEVDSGRRD